MRSKSRLVRHAHRSLSLSLLFERFQSSRERDERERRARVVSERTISSFDSLSLNAFLQISFPIKSSSHSNESERISLSRERKCLACVVKFQIRNPRQSAFTRTRKQSERDSFVPCVRAKTFLLYVYEFLFTCVKACVFMTFLLRAQRAGGDYFLFPLRRERSR